FQSIGFDCRGWDGGGSLLKFPNPANARYPDQTSEDVPIVLAICGCCIAGFFYPVTSIPASLADEDGPYTEKINDPSFLAVVSGIAVYGDSNSFGKVYPLGGLADWRSDFLAVA